MMKKIANYAVVVLAIAGIVGVYFLAHHTHAQSNSLTSIMESGSSIPTSCPSNQIYLYTGTTPPTPYMGNPSGTCIALPSPYTPLYGQTGNIGGGLLLVGGCATGTATVTGATVGMTVTTPTPTDGTNLASIGAGLYGTVTAANTVTVNECALVALTPPVKQFKVAVIQ